MNGEDMINNLQDRVSKLESIAQQNRDDIKDLREKQFNDHDTLLSVKADTKYIKENMIENNKMFKEAIEKLNKKDEDFDNENKVKLDKKIWWAIGLFTTILTGLLVSTILHFIGIK